MTTTDLTIRSHNRTETATDLSDAKAIAKARAESYAAAREGMSVVWCGPSSWSTGDDVRSLGGYAVVDASGNDVADGCAVIYAPA
jgi:hypothetical protein